MSYVEAFLHDAVKTEEPPKLDAARVDELRRTVGHCKCSDIGLTANPEKEEDRPQAEAMLRAADEYLSAFAPVGGCPNCGRRASFTYGIAYGEGRCIACDYPGRANHDVPEVGKVDNLILFYHPDVLESAAPSPESEADDE